MPATKSAKKAAPSKTPARGRAAAAKAPETDKPSHGRLPQFDLEADGHQPPRVRSADLAGKWAIVYFYPKDSTPGCTREAQAFTEALPKLKKLGAAVYGVSKDSIASHCNFREKYALRIPLLSDPDLKAHKAFGAWGKKNMYGREVEGTIRSTFLVAPDGSIARAWRGVKVDGHVDAVIAALEEAKG